jgi:uncharacterized protein
VEYVVLDAGGRRNGRRAVSRVLVLAILECMIVAGLEVDEVRFAAVCERYGIATLMIFGSVDRGSAGPSSDVDVLYELRPGRRLGWEIEDLVDELSGLFGRPVDLVSRAAVHAAMRDAVLAEARPLYAA